MTDDNIRPGRSGEPLCVECLRDHLAAVRQWRREHQQSTGGKHEMSEGL
jgi:hypothetical protein